MGHLHYTQCLPIEAATPKLLSGKYKLETIVAAKTTDHFHLFFVRRNWIGQIKDKVKIEVRDLLVKGEKENK